MAVRYLNEQDVQSLVTMQDAIDVLERAFENWGSGQARNMSRQRLRTDQVMLHILAGADRKEHQLGWKLYTTTRREARFLVGIYDGVTGELSGLMSADYLGRLRTGAASGLATKFLAKDGAKTLGVIGTGSQAFSQVEAVCSVRPIENVLVYSRSEEKRESFSRLIQENLQVDSQPVSSSSELVEQAEILVTVTTSKTPVFAGVGLMPGTHINAVGANSLDRRELDEQAISRADLIVCDSIEQCQQEAGDLHQASENGQILWKNVRELSQIVSEKSFRRPEESITLFRSVGLGLEDVALGTLVLKRAEEQGKGILLPF